MNINTPVTVRMLASFCRRSFLWRRSQTFDTPADFDASFYGRFYADLSHLNSTEQLSRHYFLHGENEGRFRNLRQFIDQLELSYGKLPDTFSPREYISTYLDLQKAGIDTDWDAIEHYLRWGRREGRIPFKFNADIYRELYFGNQIISDQDLLKDFEERGFRTGRIASGAGILKSKGIVGGGRWIDELKVDEFSLLNYAWAGPITSKLSAIDAILSEGIVRLAPISFALEFQPDFYRETHPTSANQSDADLYRDWLFVGLERGEPGSPAQFFTQLGLALQSFPISFDSSGDRGTRWDALRKFVERDFAQGRRPNPGSDAGQFLIALGLYYRNRNDSLSVVAFELARGEAALRDHALQDLADCYFRLGKWGPALKSYVARMDYSGADVWTYCNGARAALRLNQIDQAFAILKAGREHVVGSPEWRKVLKEAIDAEFELAGATARNLLKQGASFRENADAIMYQAVENVVKRFADFDPLGVSLPVGPTGKVVVLANVDLRQCSHYRVEQKEQLFEWLGRDYQIFPASNFEEFISALPGSAAAIFYRLPAFPSNVRAIEIARALGVPTFYDVDDLIFDSAEYPEPFETYGGAITRDFYEMLQYGVPLFRAAMSLCDYGIASTTSLAVHVEKVVRKRHVFVLPNGLDNRNSSFLDAPPARVRQDDSIVIFYGSGTKAHNSDFLDLAGPGLIKIMERDPRVRLMIVGYLSLNEDFQPFRDRIISVGWVPDVKSYWSLLAEADINIAVLAPYATTDAKSEIKWLEAAAMGIPSVVSGTDRYREVLEDGVDVLIANDPASWTAALETMVERPEERKRIAKHARDKAAAHYSIETNAKIFADILPPATHNHSQYVSSGNTRRRVILVNIFFPPQTLGGSPRVVRDNLDNFLDSPLGRDFEFAVVTTDFGAEGTSGLRVENYRGCPVFRISTPNVINMEWWPSHPRIGEIFAEILDLWEPDLVHFHCVERLSASVVEQCLKKHIPYITTLHDAWWISDWHFLTDMKDRLRQPGESFPFDPPPTISVGESLDRRRMLAPLLSASEAILGVSTTFTDIYRRCGFEKAIAVPNGVSPFRTLPRTASPRGRVRLAHVGSMTKFKGYFLVQAVLKQANFSRLELTVVDHSRYGGEEQHFTWGKTPVRIVGKTEPEYMPNLYAQHDVLLAPSLWPEPFGLVSREALSAGLWVLASDRGAVGEDVTHCVNGWVIDVTTPESLSNVLAEIDSNADKYLHSPSMMPLRTANEQAHDLLAIYSEVLRRSKGRKIPFTPQTVNRPQPHSTLTKVKCARGSNN